jgi:drug/metabolite transporter (DMT)-like permease
LNTPTPLGNRLSLTAFATLLLIALMMGTNHVAARFAFENGVDVATAVTLRSGGTAVVLALLLWQQKLHITLTRQNKRGLLAIGALIAVQSLCIYSAVARIPVALALLAFNSYPLWTAMWARLIYKHRPDPFMLRAMPVILVGLALALDVLGASSGLGAQGQWALMGTGVAFALTAAVTFGLALVLIQHETVGVDGRVRTLSTMTCVLVLGLIVVGTQGGFHLPTAAAGWWGLMGLMVLYGTAFTIMFTLLPRLGVVGNSAIMNVEPIFALVLAWLLLDQTIAPVQVVGGLLVVAMVIALGMRKS